MVVISKEQLFDAILKRFGDENYRHYANDILTSYRGSRANCITITNLKAFCTKKNLPFDEIFELINTFSFPSIGLLEKRYLIIYDNNDEEEIPAAYVNKAHKDGYLLTPSGEIISDRWQEYLLMYWKGTSAWEKITEE